jgi:FkbM family methyltransferase
MTGRHNWTDAAYIIADVFQVPRKIFMNSQFQRNLGYFVCVTIVFTTIHVPFYHSHAKLSSPQKGEPIAEKHASLPQVETRRYTPIENSTQPSRNSPNKQKTYQSTPPVQTPHPGCEYDTGDEKFFSSGKPPSVQSYIVLNEARSGSSWLQEISYAHPAIKVQFELGIERADAALSCMQCKRNSVSNSKFMERIPQKKHPPDACGMTMFGSANQFDNVRNVAARNNAKLVLLLRMNHVAHAISGARHFDKASASGVMWKTAEFRRQVEIIIKRSDRLLHFAVEPKRPTYLIIYEDMKRNPERVWRNLERFLGISRNNITNLKNFHPMSSTKPPIHYLQHLAEIQRDINATTNISWKSMILNPLYDEEVNPDKIFRSICERLKPTELWMHNSVCRGGVLQTPDSDQRNKNWGFPSPLQAFDERGLGLYRQTKLLLGHQSSEVTTRSAGAVTYDQHPHSWAAKSLQGYATWEAETFASFDHWLSDERVQYHVDFGTWIGPTLLYAAQKVKRAVGFEGDPVAFAVVERNLQWNEKRPWRPNIDMYAVAVVQGQGEGFKNIEMRSSSAGNSCSGVMSVAPCAYRKPEKMVTWNVSAISLPAALKRLQIPATDETFVKVDVESFECELFPSWRTWLETLSRKPTLRITFHSQIRKCSDAQYSEISKIAALYKSLWLGGKKISGFSIPDATVDTNRDTFVFTDLTVN